VDEVSSLDVIPNAVDQSELHPFPEALNEDSREAVDLREEALPPVEADNELPLTPEEMDMTTLKWKMMQITILTEFLIMSLRMAFCCLKHDIWTMILANTL
jgi:hypothetical protein